MTDFIKGINNLAVVVVLLLGVGLGVVDVEGASVNKNDSASTMLCSYISDMGTSLEKAFPVCQKETKSEVPNWDAPIEMIGKYLESVAKNDFNDKCFSKCLMGKLNLLTPDGTVDMKVVEKLYHGGNMTEPARKVIMKEWNTCNTKIEKDFPGGGDEQKICKRAAALENCLFKKAEEIELPC